MFILIIRFFFLTFCSIYIFYRLLNISHLRKFDMITDISFSVIISFCAACIPEEYLIQKNIMIIFSLSAFLFIRFKFLLSTVFITAIISFALSYTVFTAVAFFISMISAIFSHNYSLLPYNLIISIVGILQFLFIYRLFQISRFKKGMPFLLRPYSINTGVSISLFIIIFYIILPYMINLSFIVRFLPLFITILLYFLLLIWWRRRITQTYLERLRTAELESLRVECEEKDKKIKELTDNNDLLAGIIHKDNKLLPAMENAVFDFLSVASAMNGTEQKQYGESLRTQLKEMLLARTDALNHYQNLGAYKSLTGIGILDGVCNHMQQLANAKQITIDFRIHDKLKENIPDYLNVHDIGHILADLSTNAIYAVAQQENKKKLHIHLGFQKDVFIIEIKDSGIEFDIFVYNDLGLTKHTTHKETGGSGIGLIDIWKLKQKYSASILIQEYFPTNSEFTKKISIIFDKKNIFLLHSYRYTILQNNLSRNDLLLIPYTENK